VIGKKRGVVGFGVWLSVPVSSSHCLQPVMSSLPPLTSSSVTPSPTPPHPAGPAPKYPTENYFKNSKIKRQGAAFSKQEKKRRRKRLPGSPPVNPTHRAVFRNLTQILSLSPPVLIPNTPNPFSSLLLPPSAHSPRGPNIPHQPPPPLRQTAYSHGRQGDGSAVSKTGRESERR